MLRESGPRPCHNLIPRRRQRHARIFLRACSVLKQSFAGFTPLGVPLTLEHSRVALHSKRARKGVFITTGTFSAEAVDYVSRIDPRVVLIDGHQLAEYMLDLSLGVTSRAMYELKRIDSDYFAEE